MQGYGSIFEIILQEPYQINQFSNPKNYSSINIKIPKEVTMCGRYYVDNDTAREIERIIRIADEKIRNITPRDVHPTDMAPVLMAEDRILCCHMQKRV